LQSFPLLPEALEGNKEKGFSLQSGLKSMGIE
jgi:hypothetical protein